VTGSSIEAPTETDIAVIRIDYEAGTSNPARVFHAMAKLIDALQTTDRDFVASLGVELFPVLVLERVEASSIKAIVRTVLHQVDDDALRNLEWRPLVGQYLVRAKHAMLRWLADRDTIENRAQLDELRRVVAAELPSPVPGLLQLPAAPSAELLLRDVQGISEALHELGPHDAATLESADRATPFNKKLNLSSSRVEDLLTEERLTAESELTLLIKKPDYLGRSRWEFRYDQHVIEARIDDEDWLATFREGTIVLRPGDALRALVHSEVNRGFEGNVVSTHYTIVRVLGVVHAVEGDQGFFGVDFEG